jgi:hypothetical protein
MSAKSTTLRVVTIERVKIPAVAVLPGITPAIRAALEAAYRTASEKGYIYAIAHLGARDKERLDQILASRPR